MKENITYLIQDSHFDIATYLDIVINIERKTWFRKQVTVTLVERLSEERRLYVEPRFEEIAYGIHKQYLSSHDLKNIKWLHFNDYRDKYNPDSISKFTEVKTTVKKGKIRNAEWIFLDNKFELN